MRKMEPELNRERNGKFGIYAKLSGVFSRVLPYTHLEEILSVLNL